MEWLQQFIQWMGQLFSGMMTNQQQPAQPAPDQPTSSLSLSNGRANTRSLNVPQKEIDRQVEDSFAKNKHLAPDPNKTSLDEAKKFVKDAQKVAQTHSTTFLYDAPSTEYFTNKMIQKAIDMFPQHKEALTAHFAQKEHAPIPSTTQQTIPTQKTIEQPSAAPTRPQGVTEDVALQASKAAATINVQAGTQAGERIALRTKEKDVQLSFDDGIMGEGTKGEEVTKDLLDYLKKHNAKATFFITTDTIDNPVKRELVKRMVREGHEVGVHSTNHDYGLIEKSTDEIRKDVVESKRFLEGLIREEFPDYNVALFRPPGGMIHERYQRVLAQEGLAIAMWDHDTEDYKTKGGAELGEAARTAIRQGQSNVLMHNADLPVNDPRFPHPNDRFRGDGKELTVVQKLDAFLPQLRKEGYQFETLSEALREEGHSSVQGGTLIGASSADAMLASYTTKDKNRMRA